MQEVLGPPWAGAAPGIKRSGDSIGAPAFNEFPNCGHEPSYIVSGQTASPRRVGGDAPAPRLGMRFRPPACG
jgi:hypothetical protein